jgi:hypothetical protein
MSYFACTAGSKTMAPKGPYRWPIKDPFVQRNVVFCRPNYSAFQALCKDVIGFFATSSTSLEFQ